MYGSFYYDSKSLPALRPFPASGTATRRIKVSIPYRVLDAYCIKRFSLYDRAVTMLDVIDGLFDYCYDMVNLSGAYEVEIWHDRRTQRYFIRFMLAD